MLVKHCGLYNNSRINASLSMPFLISRLVVFSLEVAVNESPFGGQSKLGNVSHPKQY